MKFGAAQFVLLLAGLACRAAAEVSGWDELQLRLLEDRATPVRWFNVGRSQFISGGDTVRAQWGWAPDYVELAPGQEAVVSVPGAAWLRLVGRSAHFAPGDISLSVSTDGRAFTDAVLIGTTDSRSWLVALPRADCVVIRLAHRADATAPVAFELYFSQVWPLDTILPYRDAVPLAGNSRLIRDRFEPIFQRAWLVEPGRAAELTVSGPTRLQLIARTDWGAAGAVANRLVVVQLQLDDGPVAPLVLVPELEDEVGLNLLRSLGPVSKRMVAFVSVPAGTHRLRVTPSVPTYISVFRQEERPFLVPALNAPRAGAMESAQFGPPPAVGDVLAQLTADPGRYPAGELAAFEQAAWWFAIANQFRDAAGQAADSAARISRGRWDYPPVHRTAARLRQRGTFYRELLPMSDSGSIALEHACFAPERVRAARAATEFVTVVSPTLEHARELLADAHFVPVPDSASEPLIYAVPARAFESDLRLAALVPGYGHAEFYVQLDDAPPVRVAVRDRTRTDTLEVAMPRAFAVLGVMAREARCSTGVELQPAFGEFDLPLRIEPAAVAELALPARTRVVRLYREPSAPEVKVSVAYRAARTFALSESDYLALLDQLGPGVALGMVTNFGTLPDEFGPARVLASHLVPLWRLVRAHSADFSKGIEPVPGSDEAVRGLAPAEVREVESAARAFEAAGRYVEAIGCWSRLFWTCGREGRAVAALEIMRLLQLVGEEHLAAQYARFALCSSAPDRLPARAIEFLADAAAAHDDPDQLERLRAFVFSRCPCTRHLRDLVLALAANSRHQLVLSAGLLLPPAERPLEPMLIAALHLNWWCTYDRLLESLATEQEKCFWRAHKALAFGRFDSAEQYLAQAGYIGTNSLAALRAGLRIRARLAARSMADRLAALIEWEQWQLAHPGPRVWSEAAELVSECAGGELLYNCELDSYVRCYRADPTAPVCIRFLGPARLRVEARPLVPAPCEAPLDDWLEVWEHCMTNRVAMSQVVANPALQPVNKTNAVAGQRSTATFDFGPGFHEVRVRARTNSVLVRVFREVPALPLRVLPVLTPWRAEEVFGGVWAQMREARRLELERGRDVWLVRAGREWAARGTESELRTNVLQEAWSTAELTRAERLRLGLRIGPQSYGAPEPDAEVVAGLPVPEQWLAALRWGRLDVFGRWDALSDHVRASYLMSAGRIQELLESGLPADPAERLNMLLQVAELWPEWEFEACARAELAVAESGLRPGAKELLDRLRRRTTWVPLPVRPECAGLRPIELACDTPQYEPLRVRQALLEPPQPGYFTLGGQSVFAASLTLNRPATLGLSLEPARAGFAPFVPMTVVVELDKAEALRVRLGTLRDRVVTNLNVGGGMNALRVWIADPVANQFVRVGLTVDAAEPADSTNAPGIKHDITERHYFHVATPEQPVRFYWRGPALLRVDRLDDGMLTHQLRYIPAGEQLVELRPPPGYAEAPLRIFALALQTNRVVTRPAVVIREPESVPPSPIELPETAPPGNVVLRDYYPLGGQEDGTFTAELMYARRRPLVLDEDRAGVANEFVELSAAHRKVSPDETLWARTEGLARFHTCGDVTLGAEQRFERRAIGSRLNWLWLGKGYFGLTGGGARDAAGAVYSSFELGPRYELSRKSELYPSVTLFGRYLTLDPDTVAGYEYVDHDLYTLYKHTHRWGAVLGTQLNYRPWLDTLVRCDVELVSNENFTPDNCGLRVAWAQLLGSARAELGWRLRQFFGDADRASSVLAHGVFAGVFAERWLTGSHRLELGLMYRHDWPGAASSYFVVLRCDFGRGRGYRDHGPRESLFRDLRSSRLPAAFNNALQSEPFGSRLP